MLASARSSPALPMAKKPAFPKGSSASFPVHHGDMGKTGHVHGKNQEEQLDILCFVDKTFHQQEAAPHKGDSHDDRIDK